MEVVFTDHANSRLENERDHIRRSWVLDTIARPDMILDTYNGRKEAMKTIAGITVTVIYVQEGNKKIVVTVY